jgi:hypothetical protein
MPLEGLPEYGVTLSGNVDNPVIENHSGKVVIGYVVKQADQNGRGLEARLLLAPSGQPEGIPDGGSLCLRSSACKSNRPDAKPGASMVA